MPAIEVFADTSGWGNLVDPSQKHHAQAVTIYRDIRRQGGKFITTNYVINELVALFTSPLRLPREKTIAFIDAMKMSAYVEIVHIDTNLDIEAWEMLKQFRDKDWSLVDCSSFVLMKQRGIVQAWAHDHHMSNIFLSHSHQDKIFVRKLASDIINNGHSVWIDDAEINVGDSIIEKIGNALKKVDYVCAIISDYSINSNLVKKELEIAQIREFEHGKVFILPILISDVPLPMFLWGKLYADFRCDKNYS